MKNFILFIRQTITTSIATYALLSLYYSQQKTPKPFKGQAYLFKNPIYCHSLTMDWLLHVIRENDTSYLKDEKKVVESMIETNNKIIAISKQPDQDYINYAFVATDTPYEQKEVPFSEYCKTESLDTLLNDHQYAFFQYPTKTPNISHAVGFSREKNSKNCKFFDPDYPRGEINGPCDEVLQFMAHRFFTTGSDNHQPDNKAQITVEKTA